MQFQVIIQPVRWNLEYQVSDRDWKKQPNNNEQE